jgi:hypothetical protein
LRSFPLFDIPNYDFENNNKENKNFKYEEEKNNEKWNGSLKEEKEINYKNKNETQRFYDNIKNESYINDINYNNNNNVNNYNKKYNENNKFINNFIIDKKEKTERTVEDIIEYDQTNKKYAPFITKIINSIIKEKNTIKNGNSLSDLSYKLSNICIKIKKNITLFQDLFKY